MAEENYAYIDGKKILLDKETVDKIKEQAKPSLPFPNKVYDLEFSYILPIRNGNTYEPFVKIHKDHGSEACNYTIPETKRIIEILQGYVDFAEEKK